ncbi:putative zinc ribbon protein [Erwinia mallotivora]|uniref:putative zinc ribbon protein n=1 Tax=Erwinia mallotivora TaxID=69222 RepID=UPI003F684988
MIGGLDAPVTLPSWYCVWCGSHYQGRKHCGRCHSGIYSIEETSWQRNYCCNTPPG